MFHLNLLFKTDLSKRKADEYDYNNKYNTDTYTGHKRAQISSLGCGIHWQHTEERIS